MNKSNKKIVKDSVKGKEEGEQGTLFKYETQYKKVIDKSSYRLVTKGRPFTVKV